MMNDTGAPLDAERARLRAKGFTDAEISPILVHREKSAAPTLLWQRARACVVGAAAAVVAAGAAWAGRHAYDHAQRVDPSRIHVFCEETGVQPLWLPDRSKITFSELCSRSLIEVECPKGVDASVSWVLGPTADGYRVTSDKCTLYGALNREQITRNAQRFLPKKP
jgi:hypothetical protein